MRRNLLNARRLRGDLELGLDSVRLGGDDAKAWARMDFPGRRLPGLEVQSIYVASETQNYELGTRRVEYGRTFRYCKAGEAITEATSARMLANGNYAAGVTGHTDEDGFNGNPVADAEIGAKYVDLDEAAADRAANFFQGGYLQSLPAADPITNYYVVKSDASAALYTRVYLDHPLIQAIPTTAYVGVCACPYSKVIQGNSAIVPARYRSFIGMPLVNTSDGYFFWLQTAGPVWIQPGSWADARLPGYDENYRDVYAAVDGAISSAWAADPSSGFQRVGYLLDATASGYGSVFIMLQLDQ